MNHIIYRRVKSRKNVYIYKKIKTPIKYKQRLILLSNEYVCLTSRSRVNESDVMRGYLLNSK